MKVEAYTFYRIFKYTVYLLLSLNVVLFFREEYLANFEIYPNGIPLGSIIEAYAATIDTLAWVILLLMFELETAVIPDEKLKGALKWWMLAVRTVCYGFIVSAFFGYVASYSIVAAVEPFATSNLCDLVGQGYTYMHDLDEYPALSTEICGLWAAQELVQISGTQILGTQAASEAIINLAIVDIINSGDWIVIVVMLEVEVFLQLRNALTPARLKITKLVKSILYLTLLACAVYWGIHGDFLDFWDAFLWIVAFVFIELNVFEWNAETRRAAEPQTA
ncbi:MAG: hypothetical protein AAF438_08690 [Pseudomonadota bacterium]